eukprot:2229457-Rhodomonas_salina.1
MLQWAIACELARSTIQKQDNKLCDDEKCVLSEGDWRGGCERGGRRAGKPGEEKTVGAESGDEFKPRQQLSADANSIIGHARE